MNLSPQFLFDYHVAKSNHIAYTGFAIFILRINKIKIKNKAIFNFLNLYSCCCSDKELFQDKKIK
ncbi:hypothetical protein BOO93_18020 [Vibrio navarrensis]|nr:hypothetical protein [Vibrio navarrensis]